MRWLLLTLCSPACAGKLLSTLHLKGTRRCEQAKAAAPSVDFSQEQDVQSGASSGPGSPLLPVPDLTMSISKGGNLLSEELL